MRTSPFSLSAVAHSLPAQTVHVNQWVKRCGLPNARARALRDHGVGHFHDAEGESPANLAVHAIAKLLRETATPRSTVDALIHTHTIQTSVLAPPASTAHYIQRHCGLNRALTFSVTQQQCVSPMAAIRVLLALAARHPTIERAIIVCADAIGSGCDRLRAIGDMALHSDGACALLLDRGPNTTSSPACIYIPMRASFAVRMTPCSRFPTIGTTGRLLPPCAQLFARQTSHPTTSRTYCLTTSIYQAGHG